MKNPWEEIPLDDYENHMKLDTVMQLQAMNEMMRGQLETEFGSSVMILGIAGGNGLEHIPKDKVEKIYAVDVNAAYLQAVIRRHSDLGGILECLRIDLLTEADRLPEADMVIANLIVEYIGYECFQNVIQHVKPGFVSCVIQTETEDGWVSPSPYVHVFDRLEAVHHQMKEQLLIKAMAEIDYPVRRTWEYLLPDGKKLVQLDFEK